MWKRRSDSVVLDPLRRGESPFIVFLVLVAVAMACLATFTIWRDYQNTLDRTRNEARNLARLLETNVESMVDKTDFTLRAVARQVRDTGFPGPTDRAGMNALLETLLAAQPELEGLRVLDRDGNARYGRDVPLAPLVNFADREYFQKLRDHPEMGLLVSRPYAGRLSNRWGIAISRALVDPDGRFLGIVSAILSTASFEKIGKDIELGANGLAGIRSADMTLIHGYPLSRRGTQEIGVRSVSPDLEALIRSGQHEGEYISHRADGVERMASVRKVGAYPLFVIVGLASEDYLGDWLQRARMVGGLASVAILIGILLSRWLLRSGRHLHDAEALWRFALHGSAQGVWDWDIANGEAFLSDRSRELMGLKNGDARVDPEDWWKRVHPEDVKGFRQAVGRHLRGDTRAIEYEFRTPRPNGSGYVWVLSRGMVVDRDESGRPTRMIGTHTDVTQRKLAEIELVARGNQVEQLNRQLARRAVDAETVTRAKDAFLRNVTHELRTPLHQIQGALDLIRRDVTDERPRKWIEMAWGSSKHLQNLIDQTLNAASIGAGTLTLETVAFAPRRVVEEVGHLMAAAARAKGLMLQVEPDLRAPESLMGDPDRLAQALLNYVDNAIKFTQQGSITVRSQVLSTDAGGARMRFEVRDTGMGIAEADRSKLFRPFTQVDDSTTRRFGGMGIGLSNSREIARLMGGETGVESLPGQGSTFWLTAYFQWAEPRAPAATGDSEPAET
jgi:signal transduction histidine kinase